MSYESLRKEKYAGICADMRGVRHFWRKVPEIQEGGWKEKSDKAEASGRADLEEPALRWTLSFSDESESRDGYLSLARANAAPPRSSLP